VQASPLFRDRSDAGRFLAERLEEYAGRGDLVVLALPRGGVPVAYEVAKALGAPLDVLIVRKLGVPGYPELAMGAVASGGELVLDAGLIRALGIPRSEIDRVVDRELRELARREAAYRGASEPPRLTGKTAVIVDDGLATGASMRAAVRAARRLGAARVVVAVPVGTEETCNGLRREADEVVCATKPQPFLAVGSWYADFEQTSDEEVRELLERASDPVEQRT
jgi:predicted phosphoribosyltransferase